MGRWRHYYSDMKSISSWCRPATRSNDAERRMQFRDRRNARGIRAINWRRGSSISGRSRQSLMQIASITSTLSVTEKPQTCSVLRPSASVCYIFAGLQPRFTLLLFRDALCAETERNNGLDDEVFRPFTDTDSVIECWLTCVTEMKDIIVAPSMCFLHKRVHRNSWMYHTTSLYADEPCSDRTARKGGCAVLLSIVASVRRFSRLAKNSPLSLLFSKVKSILII